MAGEAGAPGAPGAPDIAAQDPTGAPPRTGLEQADEPLGGPADPEFEPFGAGVEDSTSQQTPQVLLDVEPDRDQTLILDEVAVSLAANGQAEVTLNGRSWGPYTGATDVSIPFNGAVQPYTGRVRILFQSTDGNSTTARAQVTGREV
jgi:hypothetical protein